MMMMEDSGVQMLFKAMRLDEISQGENASREKVLRTEPLVLPNGLENHQNEDHQ